MTAHIAIARREREFNGRSGPRAAFDFYMSQGIPTARETQETIRSAGGKKAQFEAYCAKFGSQFDSTGRTNGSAVVHSERQRETLTERLARLLSKDTEYEVEEEDEPVGVQVFDQENEDTAASPAPVVEVLAGLLGVSVESLQAVVNRESEPATVTPIKTKTPREIPAAKRISWPMAMALKKVATRQGVTFEITSKSGGAGTGELANYGIKFAGRKLTPAKASEIIGASKA